jgi:hypothetical protein
MKSSLQKTRIIIDVTEKTSQPQSSDTSFHLRSILISAIFTTAATFAAHLHELSERLQTVFC